MTTAEQIAHLRTLMDKATPPPWQHSGGCVTQVKHVTRDVWFIPHVVADGELIVAMRNALPSILDRQGKLEAVAEAARVFLDEYPESRDGMDYRPIPYGVKGMRAALAKLDGVE